MATTIQLSPAAPAGFARVEEVAEVFLSATESVVVDDWAALTAPGVRLIGGGYSIIDPASQLPVDKDAAVTWNGPTNSTDIWTADNKWRVRLVFPPDPSAALVRVNIYGYFATLGGVVGIEPTRITD